jgi:hypothetical protein
MHRFKTVLSEEVKFKEHTINLSQIKTYQHYIRTPITALASHYNVFITLKYVSIQRMNFNEICTAYYDGIQELNLRPLSFGKYLTCSTHILKKYTFWKREHINHYT